MDYQINDFQTKDVICYVLEFMGKKKLSNYVKNNSMDLDDCIRYIKFKSKQYSNLQEIINYYL